MWVWWLTPVNPTLVRCRQKDQEFEDSKTLSQKNLERECLTFYCPEYYLEYLGKAVLLHSCFPKRTLELTFVLAPLENALNLEIDEHKDPTDLRPHIQALQRAWWKSMRIP
jgi:hypothetical protein